MTIRASLPNHVLRLATRGRLPHRRASDPGSLSYVSWKKRKVVAWDLKAIYRAPTLEAAGEAQEVFAERWDGRLPRISRMWQAHWANLTPFLD